MTRDDERVRPTAACAHNLSQELGGRAGRDARSRGCRSLRRWLEAKGWQVDLEVNWVDVTATREGRTLLAEAKGRSAAIGLDVDTAYGQLLRRMTDDQSTAYAIVVPSTATRAALRVPDHVLTTLRLSVFSVAEDGTVQLEAGVGL